MPNWDIEISEIFKKSKNENFHLKDDKRKKPKLPNFATIIIGDFEIGPYESLRLCTE